MAERPDDGIEARWDAYRAALAELILAASLPDPPAIPRHLRADLDAVRIDAGEAWIDAHAGLPDVGTLDPRRRLGIEWAYSSARTLLDMWGFVLAVVLADDGTPKGPVVLAHWSRVEGWPGDGPPVLDQQGTRAGLRRAEAARIEALAQAAKLLEPGPGPGPKDRRYGQAEPAAPEWIIVDSHRHAKRVLGLGTNDRKYKGLLRRRVVLVEDRPGGKLAVRHADPLQHADAWRRREDEREDERASKFV